MRPREVAASRLDAGGTAYAVGIMSGTSADGVDAALTRIEREGPRRRSELISLASRSYGDALRRRVLEAQEGRLGLRDLFALGMELSEEATAAAREAAAGAGAHRLEVVGFHGQTVFHDPRGARSGTRVTVQIGEPAVLARALGAPVVSNFRMADVLAGGEGAPLVPRFDFHQFASDTRDRVLLNLGGIANLTRLRAGAGIADVVAFDCGPGNMLLDGIVAAADMATGPAAGAATGAAGGAAARSDAARFDAGGTIALRGAASEGVVGELLGDPYFSRRPPKSAGREEFGTAYLARFLLRTKGMSLEDRLRTAAAATAEGVVRAIALSGGGRPDEILVSGGGARNEALLAEIRARVGEAKVETTEPHGVPIEAKEAMAFAFLAFESLSGRPGNVPAATGAEREVVLGSITPPPAPR